MRLPILLSSLALLVSLAAGLQVLLEGDVSAPATVLEPGRSGDDLELRALLAEQQQELEALERRLLDLELRDRPERQPADRDLVTREELEELLAGLKEQAASLEDRDSMRSMVRGELEEIRSSERYQEAARGVERKREQPMEQRVSGWSRWLELDQIQEQQLQEILVRRDQMQQEQLDAWAQGTDEATLKTMEQDVQREFARSLRSILREDQVPTFSQKFGEDDGE